MSWDGGQPACGGNIQGFRDVLWPLMVLAHLPLLMALPLSTFFQHLGQLTSIPGYLNPSSRTEILHFIDNAKVTPSACQLALPQSLTSDPQPAPSPNPDF